MPLFWWIWKRAELPFSPRKGAFLRRRADPLPTVTGGSRVKADPRLKGVVANALDTGIPSGACDVAIIQDGLHHLPEPVKGFTEQLRIARRAAFFLEGADSPAGRRFDLEWEVEGKTVNHVFRWNRRMVDQVAKSYLGPSGFTNASFSFWHHNVRLEGLARKAGWEGQTAVDRLALIKRAADLLWPSGGNQFCGMVLKG